MKPVSGFASGNNDDEIYTHRSPRQKSPIMIRGALVAGDARERGFCKCRCYRKRRAKTTMPRSAVGAALDHLENATVSHSPQTCS